MVPEEADIDERRIIHDYRTAWNAAQNRWEQWASIRRAYEDLTPMIIAQGKRDGLGRIDPSGFPWIDSFSPIERETWVLIRVMGLPFYPQFPILNYFVDFANPFLRIGLEVDGHEWHLDKAKDQARDMEIVKLGWHIYRCSGVEVKRQAEDPYGEEGDEGDAHMFYCNTVEGVLSAMASRYNIWNASLREHEEWVTQALEQHRLVWFPIGR